MKSMKKRGAFTENALVVFENYKIHRHFDEQTETWYFSVIDIVTALTDSVNPRDYWFKLKIRELGSGLEKTVFLC
jgi:hypothetical protein